MVDRLERLGKALRDTDTAGSTLVMFVGSHTDEEVMAMAESHDRAAAAKLTAVPTG